MSVTSAIRDLLEKGFTIEQALVAAEAFEASLMPQRTARQERNRRYYEKTKASEKRLKASEKDNSDVSVLKASEPRARVEDISSNSEIYEKDNKKKTAREHLVEFQSELADLGAERLEAFILHRKSKRGGLTGYAAKLFRQDCADCGLSLAAGADMAMSRGWITVKSDWLKGQSRISPTGPPRTVGDMFREDARRMGIIPNEQPTDQTRRMDASDGSGQGSGSGIARRFALPANVVGRIG